MDRFWFVWSPTGNIPRFKHPNEWSARNEAARLARANAGQQFVVLMAMASYQVNDLVVKEFV